MTVADSAGCSADRAQPGRGPCESDPGATGVEGGLSVTDFGTLAEPYRKLRDRLDAVAARIAAYHPDCARRYAGDELWAAEHRLQGVQGFLAGQFDLTFASVFQMTLEEWRLHYATKALQEALHHTIWAEVAAGLCSRDDAAQCDPYRVRAAGGQEIGDTLAPPMPGT